MLPTQIYHADWGTGPKKRWLARAILGSDCTAFAPRPITNHTELISSIRRNLPEQGCALIGFDFPIGVPEKYARSAGIRDFKTFLQGPGTEVWSKFYEPARNISEISVHRPFYPFKPGGTTHSHLTTGLGVRHIDELRRECERKQAARRAFPVTY